MKKERKQLSASKKLGLLFSVIFLVVTIINMFWLIGVSLPYNKFCSKLDKYEENENVYYEKIIGDYRYSAKVPGYMDFTGYLIVGNKEGVWVSIDENGDIAETSGLYIELNIIPNIFGNNKYRLWFSDEKNGIDSFVFIDENYNYLPSKTATEKTILTKTKLVEDNIDDIKNLMNSAKTLWDI